MNFWEFMNFLPLEPAIVPALRFNFSSRFLQLKDTEISLQWLVLTMTTSYVALSISLEDLIVTDVSQVLVGKSVIPSV